jgi:hypothetical protein
MIEGSEYARLPDKFGLPTYGRRCARRATDRAEYDEYGPGRKAVTSARQITVALDGTWIRADGGARGRQLHVIAGRIECDGQLGSRFAWVPGPKVRLV